MDLMGDGGEYLIAALEDYILARLTEEKKKEFVAVVSSGKDEAIKAYLDLEIPEWEKEFEEAVKKEIGEKISG